jgi:uncharacterized protein (TIGR02246 family)
MSALKSKMSYFILLIMFCSSYAIKAQGQSSSDIRAMITKLNRSNLSQNSDSEMTMARRAIDAGNAVWVAAWAKGDAEMIPGTFTSDGKELVAGGKIYKGRKQILALMRESMKKRGGRAVLTVTTTDVWLDGNTAYETGTAVYEFTVNGQPQTLERRYFTIWKRQAKNGAWKIYANTGIAKE